MNEHVRESLEGGVLRLTLARPAKKNALNNAMYGALADALIKAESSPEVRVVLFAAEGDSFTAGNDLRDFAAVAAGTLDRNAMRSADFLGALARAEKPYVAAVQGHAVGIGLTMLLHCDVVVVADTARLSVPFVNLGLVPEAASTMLLQQRIGYARAYALFTLGEPLDGAKAVAIGLASEVAPQQQVLERALHAARTLAACPIESLKATKRLMRDVTQINAAMQRESVVFAERLRSPDAAAAFAAFAARAKR
jgi:enoyl-CoA hydratase/carnithine racemase